MYNTHRTTLQKRLLKKSNPKSKAWWEGYVKDCAPFVGVKMADIRSILHQWYDAEIKENLDNESQLDLVLALFSGEYSEEKLVGILFLQEILLAKNDLKCELVLHRFSELFTGGLIFDWNICDWFCVKVLGSMIKKEGKKCAVGISEWRSAGNLWLARASIVAFVPVVKSDTYDDLIKKACEIIIRREERFAKTAVGWILREISKRDQAFVKLFLGKNIKNFTTESLGNTTKYFDVEEKKKYRSLLIND